MVVILLGHEPRVTEAKDKKESIDNTTYKGKQPSPTATWTNKATTPTIETYRWSHNIAPPAGRTPMNSIPHATIRHIVKMVDENHDVYLLCMEFIRDLIAFHQHPSKPQGLEGRRLENEEIQERGLWSR
jgi:hypothetical protein